MIHHRASISKNQYLVDKFLFRSHCRIASDHDVMIVVESIRVFERIGIDMTYYFELKYFCQNRSAYFLQLHIKLFLHNCVWKKTKNEKLLVGSSNYQKQ